MPIKNTPTYKALHFTIIQQNHYSNMLTLLYTKTGTLVS